MLIRLSWLRKFMHVDHMVLMYPSTSEKALVLIVGIGGVSGLFPIIVNLL